MTTALFLLRCTEIGISIADLDLLTIGLVMDMWTEKGNDGATYDKVAYKAASLSQKAESQSKIKPRPSPSTLRSEHSRNQSTYNICIQPR